MLKIQAEEFAKEFRALPNFLSSLGAASPAEGLLSTDSLFTLDLFISHQSIIACLNSSRREQPIA